MLSQIKISSVNSKKLSNFLVLLFQVLQKEDKKYFNSLNKQVKH